MRDGESNRTSVQDAVGGQGGAPSVLNDEHHTRADCALVRRAVRSGWNITPDMKEKLRTRLLGIVTKTEVTVSGMSGPQSVEAPADTNAIAAARVMLAMDQTDQADEHLAEKNARLDSGLPTDGVQVIAIAPPVRARMEASGG